MRAITATFLPTATALFLAILAASADTSRYVTVTATNAPVSVAIQEGEAGQLITMLADDAIFPEGIYLVTKNGFTFTANYGITIAGPATFMITPTNKAFLMTIKITSATYDVNKTLILPPGTNQVYITLESSTNLVRWADATNGVYGSPDTARFFRIKMDKLTAP